MHRKRVVFSKMFVLRSMENELVPSPLQTALCPGFVNNVAENSPGENGMAEIFL